MTNLQTYLQTKLRGILPSWDEGAFAASPCRSGKDFGHDAVLLQ